MTEGPRQGSDQHPTLKGLTWRPTELSIDRDVAEEILRTYKALPNPTKREQRIRDVIEAELRSMWRNLP